MTVQTGENCAENSRISAGCGIDTVRDEGPFSATFWNLAMKTSGIEDNNLGAEVKTDNAPDVAKPFRAPGDRCLSEVVA